MRRTVLFSVQLSTCVPNRNPRGTLEVWQNPFAQEAGLILAGDVQFSVQFFL